MTRGGGSSERAAFGGAGGHHAERDGYISDVSGEAKQEVAGFDAAAGFDENVGDAAFDFAGDRRFHLHGLDREQLLALADGVAGFDRDADDQAGQGGADWFGSLGSALGVFGAAAASERSTTLTSRGWPLSSKKTVPLAVGVRLADGQEA